MSQTVPENVIQNMEHVIYGKISMRWIKIKRGNTVASVILDMDHKKTQIQMDHLNIFVLRKFPNDTEESAIRSIMKMEKQ